MKNLAEKLLTETRKVSTNLIGSLNYVMTYEGFKKWISKQNKKSEFITVGITDDIDLQDLDDNMFADVYYADSKWVGDIDTDEISIDDWTLSDNDIILIWKKK